MQVNKRGGGLKTQGFLKALLLGICSLKQVRELGPGLSEEATIYLSFLAQMGNVMRW